MPQTYYETSEATEGKSAPGEEIKPIATQTTDDEVSKQAQASPVAQAEDVSQDPPIPIPTKMEQSSQVVVMAETEQHPDKVENSEGEEAVSEQYESDSPTATGSPTPSSSTSSVQDENPIGFDAQQISAGNALSEASTTAEDIPVQAEPVELPNVAAEPQD